MSADDPHLQTIRRILVGLDGSAFSLAALDAAAALAARLEAELEGLFVEDADLLRLADLPCARVTSLTLMVAERTDRAQMEQRLRLRAARAEEALRRRTAALGVRATFRRVRGEVGAEIRAAAAEADLVSLGRASEAHAAPGSTVRSALSLGRPLLVAGERVAGGRAILVAYDGSSAGGRALSLAAELAARAGQPLVILLLAQSLAEVQGLAAKASTRLAGPSSASDILYAWGDPAPAALAAARRIRPALLVLGLQDGSFVERVLEEIDRPLLLVP